MHNAQCTKHNCFRYSFFKQRKQGENKGETKNNQSKKKQPIKKEKNQSKKQLIFLINLIIV